MRFRFLNLIAVFVCAEIAVSAPHPRATTYQVAMSHAWADGRLFIRGVDALYCYDLRKTASPTNNNHE